MAVRHSNVVVVKRLIMTSVAAAILKLCASLLLMMVNTIQFDRINVKGISIKVSKYSYLHYRTALNTRLRSYERSVISLSVKH